MFSDLSRNIFKYLRKKMGKEIRYSAVMKYRNQRLREFASRNVLKKMTHNHIIYTEKHLFIVKIIKEA